MSSVFYDQGCEPSGLLRLPVVLVRRLLRRIQRPFFFSLNDRLATLNEEVKQLRAETALLSASQSQRGSSEELEREGLFALGLVDAINGLEWRDRAAHQSSQNTRPLRVLFAVSSASQMYSGIGRAIFETVRRCRGRVDYTFAIDDANRRNRDLVADFARSERIPIHTFPPVELPNCLDRVGTGLASLIEHGGWDAVECVSFASTATNGTVLRHAGNKPIIYTPHYQPPWTVPGNADIYQMIDTVHGGLLRSAALVACDSPWEWLFLRSQAGPNTDCALIPLGFDPSKFVLGVPSRRPYLLFVGDLNEVRKRFPLALQIFAAIHAQLPHFQLVVVGNKSDLAGHSVPEAIRAKVILKGYVSEAELQQLNREASGLLQPTQFEAFGLPILEALACGTPVFLSRRPTVTGIFGRYRGTVLMDDDTPDRMATQIVSVLQRGAEFVAQVIADRSRLAADLNWDTLTDQRIRAIRTATKVRLRVAA